MGVFQVSPQPKYSNSFKSEQLQQIAAEFCLEKQEIHRLYQCFSSFQSKPKSYLTLNDIAQTLHYGSPNFAELPYLERLFTLISKRTPGRLFFEEYLTGISTFCLMNSEAVLRFVFDWLDHDCDDRVTLQDISSTLQYSNPKTKQRTFFCNFSPELDKLGKNKQNRLMKFQEFRQHSKTLLFVIWPAYELQEKMRELNLGAEFWKKQYFKIEKSETALKNTQRKAFKLLDKVNLLKTIKVNTESLSPLRQTQQTRRIGEPSTDLQLLQTQPRPRRKSCPYLKPFLTPHNLIQNPQ